MAEQKQVNIRIKMMHVSKWMGSRGPSGACGPAARGRKAARAAVRLGAWMRPRRLASPLSHRSKVGSAAEGWGT